MPKTTPANSEAMPKFNRRTALKGGLVLAVATHTAVAQSEPEMSSLGREFDRLYAEYVALYEAGNAKVKECEAAMLLAGVTKFSKEWRIRRSNECDPSFDASYLALEAVEAVASKIRDADPRTARDLFVKARILRFDLCLRGDPSVAAQDWDWDVECLERFIASAQALAQIGEPA